MPDQPSPVQQMIGDFAPKLVELTDDVLFGDVWERPSLPQRDRPLITVAALVALNRTEQLPGHLRRAVDNGVTVDELIEVITTSRSTPGGPPPSAPSPSPKASSRTADHPTDPAQDDRTVHGRMIGGGAH
jgi:4-carboxymuconolactone decarboxylase